MAVVEKPYEDRMIFNWRRCFGKLAPDLARTVQHHINAQASRCLKEMQEYVHKHHHIETTPVIPELVGGRLDYPVLVAKVFHIYTRCTLLAEKQTVPNNLSLVTMVLFKFCLLTYSNSHNFIIKPSLK
jgi:hypothetical protein